MCCLLFVLVPNIWFANNQNYCSKITCLRNLLSPHVIAVSSGERILDASLVLCPIVVMPSTLAIITTHAKALLLNIFRNGDIDAISEDHFSGTLPPLHRRFGHAWLQGAGITLLIRQSWKWRKVGWEGACPLRPNRNKTNKAEKPSNGSSHIVSAGAVKMEVSSAAALSGGKVAGVIGALSKEGACLNLAFLCRREEERNASGLFWII